MGEYAEYMLNGDDCQVCGEHLGGGDGFPRTCRSCQREEKNDERREALFVCLKPKALKALPKWLESRPRFNIVDGTRHDKRGQPMVVVHYDTKPDSDWGKVEPGSKSVIICSQQTHEEAVFITKQHEEK